MTEFINYPPERLISELVAAKVKIETFTTPNYIDVEKSVTIDVLKDMEREILEKHKETLKA